MGDTGPCPCSEIHVDCRPDAERKPDPRQRPREQRSSPGDRDLEQCIHPVQPQKDGTLEPLAATHVDTGMGLERLVRVLQGKTSNYDTDIFSGTIEATGKLVNKTYKADDSKESIAFRVIADHIRAIALPSPMASCPRIQAPAT